MLRFLADLPVEGKRVLLRAGFDVPLNPDGSVANDKRMRETLPTLRALQKRGAQTLILTHLGRPEGKPTEALRTAGLARALSVLLNTEVKAIQDIAGPSALAAAQALEPGGLLMLENVRFDPREEANDPTLAKELAALADVYVNDAFSMCHRAHASVVGVPALLPSAAGIQLQRELEVLRGVTDHPNRPLAVVLGGVKLETRLPLIKNMLERVGAEKILLGGAMAFPFLRAQGFPTGVSICDEKNVEVAKHLLNTYGSRIVLPADFVVATSLEDVASVQTVSADAIPDALHAFDTGPATLERFRVELKDMKTIVWSGPMGAFEQPAFAKGTQDLAGLLVNLSARVIVGGGDTVSALEQVHLEDKMGFVSTGGGAALTLLEGSALPGVTALEQAA